RLSDVASLMVPKHPARPGLPEHFRFRAGASRLRGATGDVHRAVQVYPSAGDHVVPVQPKGTPVRLKNNGPGKAIQANRSHGGSPQQDGLGKPPAPNPLSCTAVVARCQIKPTPDPYSP